MLHMTRAIDGHSSERPNPKARAHMPKVSVIIPAYNAEAFIGQCLESVCAQSLSDIEVLVVDDGSTDDTPKIVGTYAIQDDRVLLLRQENQFAGVARNDGMSHATGEYLYFLDADDYVTPNCLRFMVTAAERLSADCVVARANYHDNENGNEGPLDYAMTGVRTGVRLGQDDLAPQLFQAFKGWPWDKLFKTSFVRDIDVRYQALRTSNDALFVFVAMAEAKTLTCIDDHVVFHRISNTKSLANTRNKSWSCAIEAAAAIKDELARRGLYERLASSYENWIADFFCWHLSTLGTEAADAFLAQAQPVLDGLSRDLADFHNPRDAFFMDTVRSGRSKIIALANRQYAKTQDRMVDIENLKGEIDRLNGELAALKDQSRQEIARLNEQCGHLESENRHLSGLVQDIYDSNSYRIGNTLVRSAKAIRDLLGRHGAKKR